jgi:UDP-2,3-diacylglucosamine hydrolase
MHPDKQTPGESTLGFRGGTFISDLHLFCPRSVSEETTEQLTQFQDASDCIVLGGDIFDFRWSTHASHDASLAAAREWLEDLLSVTGESRIVFLPGNHDCVPEFLEDLELLAAGQPRFSWHNHHVQINDCLFLHGDILDAGPSFDQLASYRSKFHHAEPKSRLSQRSYDVAVAMRIHKLIPNLIRLPRRTCKDLLSTLRKMDLVDSDSVQRIYFGHTHVAIDGIEVDGIKFFNPGGSLRHLKTHDHQFLFANEVNPKNVQSPNE